MHTLHIVLIFFHIVALVFSFFIFSQVALTFIVNILYFVYYIITRKYERRFWFAFIIASFNVFIVLLRGNIEIVIELLSELLH